MKRRTFIKNSSLLAISVSAFGGIHWNGKNYVGDTQTTTDILGPFYRPGAPYRSNITPPGSKGIPLSLSGTIFQSDGKTPLNNAVIEIWQCDEKENYDNTSDEYLFRGAVKTARRVNMILKQLFLFHIKLIQMMKPRGGLRTYI
jgi:hypothetical protein